MVCVEIKYCLDDSVSPHFPTVYSAVLTSFSVPREKTHKIPGSLQSITRYWKSMSPLPMLAHTKTKKIGSCCLSHDSFGLYAIPKSVSHHIIQEVLG